MQAENTYLRHIRVPLRICILLAGAAVMSAAAPAAARGTESPPVQPAEREVIPGADRMTGAERDAYRRRMEAAATPAEKAGIRAEYAKAAQAPAPARPLVGDPVRGASLHQGCFSCHGIERYVAPVTYAAAGFMDSVLRASGLSDLPPAEPTKFKGRIKSLSALREGVTRRNDYLSPKMTPQEIEDVVAYLNATYYQFPQ
jgi:mono/diheme cytochrome c family protein